MNVESGDKFQFTDSVIFCKEHIGEGKILYYIERIGRAVNFINLIL